jgi:hypothetical protein
MVKRLLLEKGQLAVEGGIFKFQGGAGHQLNSNEVREKSTPIT